MNSTYLTDDQILKLFKFVQSKWVEYIDVQHEIVDHLACGIEDQLRINPKMSFEDALTLEYSKFPLTGFIHFVETKEKEYRRFWKNKMINRLKYYGRLPNLAIPLLIMSFVFFFISVVLKNNPVLFELSLTVKILCFLSVIFLQIQYWFKRKDLLIVKTFYNELPEVHGIITIITIDPFNLFNNFAFLDGYPFIQTILYSFIITLFLTSLYASYFIYPKILKKELTNINLLEKFPLQNA